MANQPSQRNGGRIDVACGYSLFDALLERRSRRFGSGMTLPGGPLAYASQSKSQPLALEEEAMLAFAACGITGYALAELPFDSQGAPDAGCGNIMASFVGRTAPSGDAVHSVAVFVINDDGAWMLKRPQDYPREKISSLIQKARGREVVQLYEEARIQLSDSRIELPRRRPYVFPFNTWNSNVAGTTYFLPVLEHSALHINVLLSAFSEEIGVYVVDDANAFRSAGLASFAKSCGGHLNDNPDSGLMTTVRHFEMTLREFVAVEQGSIIQNLALMTEALQLGGYPHQAHHPQWLEALGFQTETLRFSTITAASLLKRTVLRLLRQDRPVAHSVALEKDGRVLMKPFCPPHYPSMEQAVLAFVEQKTKPGYGTFRDGGAATAWRDPVRVQQGIPSYTDKAIAATIAYCNYIYRRYGRFPSSTGPFSTLLAYQAHRLDDEFYRRFYRPEAHAQCGGESPG